MSFFFGEKYDIIIVGGGISGLFLAYKLKDTKQNILLIEKEKELGGRIHTIYKTDFHYECGAGRISNKHNKLMTLIDELDLGDQLYELSKDIDVIIHNKESPISIYSLFNQLFEKSKGLDKEYLKNIVLFQLLIDVFDYDTAVNIKDAFGYDSEIMTLNALAALEMFKKDLFKNDTKYYVFKEGLSKITETLANKLELFDNVTIKLSEGLEKIEDSYISSDKKNRFYYEKLILTIPQENLVNIEYLKDVKNLDSVQGIPLLRIYFKYPVKDCKAWFKDIKRTTTDNYIRHIIPVNYKKGLIMISYTDGYPTELLSSLHQRGEKVLVEAIHKEIKDIFGIKKKIPYPQGVYFHLWENGCHFWKKGFNMNEIYDSMIKPIKDKELYLCGESYSKKQAWIEGSLETCYDVLKKMKFKGMEVKIKKDKNLKKYKIDEVLKHKDWIVMEVEGELRVYDLSKWIPQHPGGDKIYNGIEANLHYKDPKKYDKTPYEIFMRNNIHKDKDVFNSFFIKRHKLVKHIGFLIL
jgi:protoporphyrinogen oxidase